MIMSAANIILAIVLMGAWQFGGSSLVGILIDAGIIWYINAKSVKGTSWERSPTGCVVETERRPPE